MLIEGLGAAAALRGNPVMTSSTMRSGAVLSGAQAAHCVQEFLRGRNHVHVAGDCLDDHAGDVVASIARMRSSSCLRIVVFEYERVVRSYSSGNTGRSTGLPNVSMPEPAFNQQGVAVAVVAAFELDDLIAARYSRGPDGWRSCRPRCRSSRGGLLRHGRHES